VDCNIGSSYNYMVTRSVLLGRGMALGILKGMELTASNFMTWTTLHLARGSYKSQLEACRSPALMSSLP